MCFEIILLEMKRNTKYLSEETDETEGTMGSLLEKRSAGT